jgi:hypothetical protein
MNTKKNRNYVNAKELYEEVVKSKYHHAYVLNVYDYERLGMADEVREYNGKKLFRRGDQVPFPEEGKIGKVVSINHEHGTALVIFGAKEGKPKLSPKATQMLMKMADHIATALQYKYQDDRLDCIQSALEDVCRYWSGFDPEKSDNAFSYFTQMLKHGMAKGWKKLHRIKTVQRISISEDNGMYNI